MTTSLARWACPCGRTSIRATHVDGPLHCPRCRQPLDRQATVGQARIRDGGPGDVADALERAWQQLARDDSAHSPGWMVYAIIMYVLVLFLVFGVYAAVIVHA